MNRNIKLFPPYLALCWDVFFVWTISTMFFTTQKGLSFSSTVLLDSFLMLFGAIFAILVPKLFNKIPPLRSTQIGFLGYGGYLLLVIFGNNYFIFIIAQAFLGFGYSVQGIKSNSLFTNSLSLVKRDKDYQRIYGKGLSLFYVIEAVGAILITYVYSWQPYAAYWLSLAVVVFAFVYSLLIKEPAKFQDSNISVDAREQSQEKSKPDSYFKIIASGFVIALLVYVSVFRGAMAPYGSAFKMYLQLATDNGTIPLWIYGYIYAGLKICTALSSKYQFKFDLKFGVKSLLILNFCLIITYIVNAIMYIIAPFTIPTLIVIIIMTYIQASLRMPNTIFVNNYIQVCTHKKNHERIFALRTFFEYMSYALLTLLYSQLLSGFNDNYGWTVLTYVAICALPIIISMFVFIRLLIKKYAQKYTIIKKEYTED